MSGLRVNTGELPSTTDNTTELSRTSLFSYITLPFPDEDTLSLYDTGASIIFEKILAQFNSSVDDQL